MGRSQIGVIIHRGSREIGGTCIELKSEGASLFLDLGLPLSRQTTSVDVDSLRPDAVLVSHPHLDHYGLVDRLPPSVPVYMTPLAQDLVDSTRLFLGKRTLRNDIRHFTSWVPFEVGPFRIHPFLVDHSSPEAHAFLIEVQGKRLFYSGDFRATGRKRKLFDRMIERPPKPIDLLLLEGTMLGRDNGEFPTEASVEDPIVQVLREHAVPAFLVCSSQNIDRIVSAFRACKKTGRSLVIDAYTAWVLDRMRQVSGSVPNLDWDGIRVYVSPGQYARIKEADELRTFIPRLFGPARIKVEELEAHPERFLWVSKMSSGRTIRRHLERGRASVIYSQWKGYLDCSDEEYVGASDMRAFMNDEAVNFVYAHTSGHATVEDLRRFSKALEPTIVVPIHTEHSEEFGRHIENVVIADDGCEFDA
ncbi:MAG: MBL fold metallo-hydrolase [Deferrisomatales bacterium]|nr:MBL fold metallo-hydrolase [Deferrisomatales bacterium]